MLVAILILSLQAYALVDTYWYSANYGSAEFTYWSEKINTKGDEYVAQGDYNTSHWQNVTILHLSGPGISECYAGFTNKWGIDMFATTPVNNTEFIGFRRGPDDCIFWAASNLGKINAAFEGYISLAEADSRGIPIY